MKKSIFSALLLMTLPAVVQAAPVTPTTIGFDDLTTATGAASITGIPNGYNGLTWYNFYVGASDALSGSTFSNGVVSGNYAAYDGYGGTPATISSSTPFLLDSADLTDVWDTTDTVEVQGLRAGHSVFDTTLNLSSSAPSSPTDFTAIDSSPIDTLDFTVTGDPLNDNFALDNLTITAVPEPASLGLLVISTAALLGRRIQRRA